MPNKFEREAARRFVERQTRARIARQQQQREKELRPSSHQYSSPARPQSEGSATRGSSRTVGYAARYTHSNSGNNNASIAIYGSPRRGWDASTKAIKKRREIPRTFQKNLQEKYHQISEARERASLESVEIDTDFRPGITALLRGFKTRCRNRMRDRTISEIWNKMNVDALLPQELEVKQAQEEAASARLFEREDDITGSARWVQRQRLARQEHERISRRLTLRESERIKVENVSSRWLA